MVRESTGRQHLAAQLLGQRFKPCHFVNGRADSCKRNALRQPDVAEEHVAQVQRQAERQLIFAVLPSPEVHGRESTLRLLTGGQGTFAGTGGGLRVFVDGEDRQNRIPDEGHDLTIVREHRTTGALEVQ